MFTQAPCRASPDFSVGSKPFILTIDFSKQAVDAILSQDQHGAERFFRSILSLCRQPAQSDTNVLTSFLHPGQ